MSSQLCTRLFGCEFANMTAEDFEFNHAIIERVLEWHEVDGWWFNSDDQRTCDVHVLDPKNHIAHAWYLVERLMAEGYRYSIEYDDHKHTVIFMPASGGITAWAVGEGDTIEHAICLAALSAMEAKCASES